MVQRISLVVDRSKINRWQAARILAALQGFVFVIEPSAVVSAIYCDDDPSNDQIGWTLVAPKQAGSKVLVYFGQLLTGASA